MKKRSSFGKLMLLISGLFVFASASWSCAVSNAGLGVYAAFLLGGVLIVWSTFYEAAQKRIPKILRIGFIVALILVFGAIAGLLAYGSTDTVTYQEDVVLVLGCGVRKDQPGPALKSRLDKTVDYFEKNPDVTIIVSGGQGAEEQISEALAMERYLVAHGIPAERIIKEDQSTSTYENFQFCKTVLESFAAEGGSIAFITNEFHIYRSQYVARLFGFESITHCHSDSPWYTVIPHGLRECLAIVKYWFY